MAKLDARHGDTRSIKARQLQLQPAPLNRIKAKTTTLERREQSPRSSQQSSCITFAIQAAVNCPARLEDDQKNPINWTQTTKNGHHGGPAHLTEISDARDGRGTWRRLLRPRALHLFGDNCSSQWNNTMKLLGNKTERETERETERQRNGLLYDSPHQRAASSTNKVFDSHGHFFLFWRRRRRRRLGGVGGGGGVGDVVASRCCGLWRICVGNNSGKRNVDAFLLGND